MPDDFARSPQIRSEPRQSDTIAGLLTEFRLIVREELVATGGAAGRTPVLLTADDVADLLRVDTRTLRRMVVDGVVPPPLHIGRRAIRWNAASLYSALGIEKG